MSYSTSSAVPTVLTKIVEQRLESLKKLEQHYSPEHVLQQAMNMVRQEKFSRSLKENLLQGEPGFILECKKASPSKGVIRSDFDPVAIAKTYQPYASAISVLTEPDFFQGSFDYLQAVRSQVSLPLLCKDFIVLPYQVALAKYFGADAILLMLSILDDRQYAELCELATKLKLEVLTEVSNEVEMQRAKELGASIIGINNRNLRDLTVDLSQTDKLAALAPSDAVLIAESGYTTHDDVRKHGAVVDGFLVGSHLTAQVDIDLACRQLIFGENKVCGITHPNTARVAAASGAVFGGFIHVSRSPRKVELTQAATITKQVPELNYIGVFSAEDPQFNAELVVMWVREARLFGVQIHDLPKQEDSANQIIQQIKDRIPASCEVWAAVNLNSEKPNLPDLTAARYVVDHGRGGTGQQFDWSLLPKQRANLMLAGGLGSSNVLEAISTGCRGYDFNSRLETQPGFKNAHAISQLFKIIRKYGRHVERKQEQ
ncbi:MULTISPECIES: bifunctional indole-3-glycerol-phosphate synthase TrpC/phosphoribosylanthranilate isomerase TrpF [Gammaproteobacteria]|uniref:bifunctional indole-3-glycerol-phosphate synthase TrpC/phosphoribosylanthranilate isomerase TrpF n=1 Tax=Gammaproteobacteria TaxID=1236 RepID=UPI000DCFE99C|nr:MULTISPECIES: bifunctional indole-3-glycerol-phosphate synthase TrpC/phosphoribosylanthranilate isomerase TrpF [Gammaproteobacteria]RTE87570.1 bifunctional indole-3-glycerol-phosphate synthase TrpC/phosphoribosylanthranilate isomerase TrpF [Aliidiomarina sp. B3213]TCZ92646.1 bifunctional indole-3-glycerol-phosphate synthase TrpC/phosphoribosylanthranilate isomerase TrpF [Lysobacter sp. N42]